MQFVIFIFLSYLLQWQCVKSSVNLSTRVFCNTASRRLWYFILNICPIQLPVVLHNYPWLMYCNVPMPAHLPTRFHLQCNLPSPTECCRWQFSCRSWAISFIGDDRMKYMKCCLCHTSTEVDRWAIYAKWVLYICIYIDVLNRYRTIAHRSHCDIDTYIINVCI